MLKGCQLPRIGEASSRTEGQSRQEWRLLGRFEEIAELHLSTSDFYNCVHQSRMREKATLPRLGATY
jgi:hypothetical protein